MCSPGYVADENFPHTCVSECKNSCINSHCTGKNTCTCFEGYDFREGSSFVCEPVCNNSCINGLCSSPNRCTCYDGYIPKNSVNDSECIAICECKNGFCNETSSMCDSCMVSYYYK